jgi:3-oxoacyl-[acyl-carrier protein] reductase
VSREKDTIALASDTFNKYGVIDILVNNAGIFPPCEFDDLTYKTWRHMIEVDLDSVFLCTKAVVPYMKKQKSGKIINISSEVFYIGFANMVDYTAAKTGVIGFTRAMAEALGEYNVHINAITPGLVSTKKVEEIFGSGFPAHIERQCIKRKQMPEDLVGPVVFLASGDSDFVTGQTINVNGGFTKH